MNQTLFDIGNEYRDILADMELHAEAYDGDITDFPLLERLEAIEGDLASKALNIAALIKEIRGEGKMILEAGQDLVKRGQAKMNRAERLHKYLADNVPANAVYEDARAKVSWAGNGGRRSTELMPEVTPEMLPPAYQRVRVEVDAEAIREVLEAAIVPGAEPEKTGEPLELVGPGGNVLAVVKPRGKSLRIK